MIGVVAITGVGILGVAPAVGHLFAGAVRGLRKGGVGPRFWDAAVFASLTLAQLGVVVVLAVRSLLSKGTRS